MFGKQSSSFGKPEQDIDWGIESFKRTVLSERRMTVSSAVTLLGPQVNTFLMAESCFGPEHDKPQLQHTVKLYPLDVWSNTSAISPKGSFFNMDKPWEMFVL